MKKDKLYLIALGGAIILFILCTIAFIKDYSKTKDYIKTEAIITKVDREYDSESDFTYYVLAQFDYKNETYNVKQRVTFGFKKKIGKRIKIYFNPQNPWEVRNIWNFRILFIGSCLLFVYILGMIIFIIKSSQNKYKNSLK